MWVRSSYAQIHCSCRDLSPLVATASLSHCSWSLLFRRSGRDFTEVDFSAMSRHRFSRRDITSCLLQSSYVGYDVVTSLLMSRHQLQALLLLNRCLLDVMTSAQVFGTLQLLVVMSRHRSSCRDIRLCCCRLHWLFVMSRLQLSCRDISLLKFMLLLQLLKLCFW